MTTDATNTETTEVQMVECLGENCIAVGDVVCLKSGGFAMTVEHLVADDEDADSEGEAYCTWAKEDETIARDSFRTEMLDNLTAEAEFEEMDEVLVDEIAALLSAKTDKTYPN